MRARKPWLPATGTSLEQGLRVGTLLGGVFILPHLPTSLVVENRAHVGQSCCREDPHQCLGEARLCDAVRVWGLLGALVAVNRNPLDSSGFILCLF